MPEQKPIVIVKTGEPVPSVLERRGHFGRLIEETIGEAWSGPYTTYDVRQDTPPDPRGAAAFVITGSAANVPERADWMLRTEGWLRDVVGAGTPTFGICFGHQLLAQALGGEVLKNPRGREMGTVRVELLGTDPLLEGVSVDGSAAFEANSTHVDTVRRLPPGAVALARSRLDDHQVIRFSVSCYGVQFHPEIDAEIMRAYIASRRDVLAGEGFDVDATLGGVTEAPLARSTLRNFVRHLIRHP